MKTIFKHSLTGLVLLSLSSGFAYAEDKVSQNWSCWSQASAKHGIPVKLLRSIAAQESSFNPKALSFDTNGTQGIGLMQINTWWLSPKAPLGRMGITKEDLWEPCLNLHIGAWILKQNFEQYGYNWRAIGAYNARTEWKRVNYAHRIYKRLNKMEASNVQ